MKVEKNRISLSLSLPLPPPLSPISLHLFRQISCYELPEPAVFFRHWNHLDSNPPPPASNPLGYPLRYRCEGSERGDRHTHTHTHVHTHTHTHTHTQHTQSERGESESESESERAIERDRESEGEREREREREREGERERGDRRDRRER